MFIIQCRSEIRVAKYSGVGSSDGVKQSLHLKPILELRFLKTKTMMHCRNIAVEKQNAVLSLRDYFVKNHLLRTCQNLSTMSYDHQSILWSLLNHCKPNCEGFTEMTREGTNCIRCAENIWKLLECRLNSLNRLDNINC